MRLAVAVAVAGIAIKVIKGCAVNAADTVFIGCCWRRGEASIGI